MTLKEFIEKEKHNGKLVGFGLEMRMKNLEQSGKFDFEGEKHQLYGFLESLYYTNYISAEEYDNLFEDTQNLAEKIYYKIWDLN